MTQDLNIAESINNPKLLTYRIREQDWAEVLGYEIPQTTVTRITNTMDGVLLGGLLFTPKRNLRRIPNFGNVCAEAIEALCEKVFGVPVGAFTEEFSDDRFLRANAREGYDQGLSLLNKLAGTDLWELESTQSHLPDYFPQARYDHETCRYDFTVPLRDIFKAAVTDKGIPGISEKIVADFIKDTVTDAMAQVHESRFKTPEEKRKWVDDAKVAGQMAVRVNVEKEGLRVSLTFARNSDLHQMAKHESATEMQRTFESKVVKFIGERLKAAL